MSLFQTGLKATTFASALLFMLASAAIAQQWTPGPNLPVGSSNSSPSNTKEIGSEPLSATSPDAVATPAASLCGSFKFGKYIGPTTLGKFIIIVGGPANSAGSLGSTAGPGADPKTYPSSASWYDGPIANSPVAPRLKKQGITSTALCYGVANGGNDAAASVHYKWAPGTLIGVGQAGDSVTFYSFTDGYGATDHSAPVDTITYTLER
jgi:hypothetical protein